MSTTGLDAFDSTLQKTHLWLHELMKELGWEGQRQQAYHALRAVLHALRDRLPPQEAVQLGAQLPLLLRGAYYEGWKLSGKPVKDRHTEDFLAHITLAFRRAETIPAEQVAVMAQQQGYVVMEDERINPEEVARAVFAVLARHVTAGEITDVKGRLPAALRDLWPA